MRRNAMTRREKDLLSRLSKIINYSEYIHANLTIAKRTCGNPRCKCVREGKKHVSLYLTTTRKNGKRKSIYIPKRLEEDVKAAVERYFKIKDTLEEISDINLSRLLSKKEKS